MLNLYPKLRTAAVWSLLLIGAVALGGCAGLSGIKGSRVNCNQVRLQHESGRSVAEIASNLGVSEADVQGCGGTASP